jgi:outer membrane lipoprotein LolB
MAKSFSTEQANSPEWQGRISVQVLGDSPSSMSASFLLRGTAQNGELDLYSPLGTTLGALQWTPEQVLLDDGNKTQYFNSLAELTEKATGAALPVEALFGWLQGRHDRATGWQADLSTASEGALFARRTSPAPEVTLRIKLDP